MTPAAKLFDALHHSSLSDSALASAILEGLKARSFEDKRAFLESLAVGVLNEMPISMYGIQINDTLDVDNGRAHYGIAPHGFLSGYVSTTVIATVNDEPYVALCRKSKDKENPDAGMRGYEIPGGALQPMARENTLAEQPAFHSTYAEAVIARGKEKLGFDLTPFMDQEVFVNEYLWHSKQMQAETHVSAVYIGAFDDISQLPPLTPGSEIAAVDWVRCADIKENEAITRNDLSTNDDWQAIQKASDRFYVRQDANRFIPIIDTYANVLNQVLGTWRQAQLVEKFKLGREMTSHFASLSLPQSELGMKAVENFKEHQIVAAQLFNMINHSY